MKVDNTTSVIVVIAITAMFIAFIVFAWRMNQWTAKDTGESAQRGYEMQTRLETELNK